MPSDSLAARVRALSGDSVALDRIAERVFNIDYPDGHPRTGANWEQHEPAHRTRRRLRVKDYLLALAADLKGEAK